MEDQNKLITDLEKRVRALESKPAMPDHQHNGFDVSNVLWDNVTRRKIYISHTIVGADAAVAANYTTFWIAPFACYVTGVKEAHQAVGSDAGAVSLQLEKLTSGVAPDSGVAMLSTALSLKATANVVQNGTLSPTLSNINLAKDDRLCLKDAGVLTGISNVSVLVELMII